MGRDELINNLAEAVIDGDEELSADLVCQAIQAGLEPLTILNESLTKGIQIVGNKFAEGYYFLPDLLLGAKAMEAGIKVLEPMLVEAKRDFVGRVIMGTVKGDLHSIGKNIVVMMLKSAGFEVFDLGVDVDTSTFIAKTKELKPDIIGISALLTTTVTRQKDIVELLEEEGLRSKVKVMIGGAPINQAWADKIGADGYAEDALASVALAKKLVGRAC